MRPAAGDLARSNVACVSRVRASCPSFAPVLSGHGADTLDLGCLLTVEHDADLPALLIGLLSIPIGLRAFIAAERYAKRTGRLKRSG